eukprot:scaffold73395_cov81-Phaeocystis_antarctica.AAC.1
MTSELNNGRGAAAGNCPGAASHHTVVRASVGASAAREEGAEQRPRRRRPRLHGCSLARHRGARQRRSQRSPRRASRAAAKAPPPETARVQPRTTP